MGVKLLCQVHNPGEKAPLMLSLDMAKHSLNSIKDLEDQLLSRLHSRFDPSILVVSCKGPPVVPVGAQHELHGCPLSLVSCATLEGTADNFNLVAAMSGTCALQRSTKLRPIAFYQVGLKQNPIETVLTN